MLAGAVLKPPSGPHSAVSPETLTMPAQVPVFQTRSTITAMPCPTPMHMVHSA